MHRVTCEGSCDKNRNRRTGPSGGVVLRARRRLRTTSGDRARAFAFAAIPSLSSQRGKSLLPTGDAPSTCFTERATSRGESPTHSGTVPEEIENGSGYAPAHGSTAGVSGASQDTRAAYFRKGLHLLDDEASGSPSVPLVPIASRCDIDLRGCTTRPAPLSFAEGNAFLLLASQKASVNFIASGESGNPDDLGRSCHRDPRDKRASKGTSASPVGDGHAWQDNAIARGGGAANHATVRFVDHFSAAKRRRPRQRRQRSAFERDRRYEHSPDLNELKPQLSTSRRVFSDSERPQLAEGDCDVIMSAPIDTRIYDNPGGLGRKQGAITIGTATKDKTEPCEIEVFCAGGPLAVTDIVTRCGPLPWSSSIRSAVPGSSSSGIPRKQQSWGSNKTKRSGTIGSRGKRQATVSRRKRRSQKPIRGATGLPGTGEASDASAGLVERAEVVRDSDAEAESGGAIVAVVAAAGRSNDVLQSPFSQRFAGAKDIHPVNETPTQSENKGGGRVRSGLENGAESAGPTEVSVRGGRETHIDDVTSDVKHNAETVSEMLFVGGGGVIPQSGCLPEHPEQQRVVYPVNAVGAKTETHAKADAIAKRWRYGEHSRARHCQDDNFSCQASQDLGESQGQGHASPPLEEPEESRRVPDQLVSKGTGLRTRPKSNGNLGGTSFPGPRTRAGSHRERDRWESNGAVGVSSAPLSLGASQAADSLQPEVRFSRTVRHRSPHYQ